MDDEIETLLVDVRANTSGFKADIDSMRSTIDGSLIDGFSRAGNVLERGLISAVRRGSLGFDDFKNVALRAINEIAAHALQSGLANLFGNSSQNGGAVSLLGGAVSALLGLPGRATGGPVAPGQAYLIGERGPEVFIPTTSGRVETTLGNTASSAPIGSGQQATVNPTAQAARDVKVSINLAAPRGSENPAILRRSTRQVASAVRRAMTQA